MGANRTFLVCEHSTRKNTVCSTRPTRSPRVIFGIRNIREPAEIQTIVIVGKQDRIADRHQGSSLATQRDIRRPKITDGIDATSSSDTRPRADLRRETHARLMEDRLPVRGHQIDLQAVARDKITQPGKILKLRGKGIPVVNGYGCGDYLIQVQVYMPKRVDRKEKEILESWRTSSSFTPKS